VPRDVEGSWEGTDQAKPEANKLAHLYRVASCSGAVQVGRESTGLPLLESAALDPLAGNMESKDSVQPVPEVASPGPRAENTATANDVQPV
jgi:hypothetical protein